MKKAISRWLSENAAEWLEAGTRLEILENKRLQLAKHQGLAGYTEHLLQVKTERGILEIQGDKLKVVSLGSEILIIEGEFKQLLWK